MPSTPSRSPRHEEPGGHLGRFHDLHAAEPAFLETALGFDDRRQAALRSARDRLLWELGPPDWVRSERDGWSARLVTCGVTTKRGSDVLVRRELDHRPRWLTEALGEIPLRRA